MSDYSPPRQKRISNCGLRISNFDRLCGRQRFRDFGFRICGELILKGGLDQLNSLPAEKARAELVKCCGSKRWASALAEKRPFANLAELFAAADRIWWSLGRRDCLEAFRAHPKIGAKKATTARSIEARRWSAEEQSGTSCASPETIVALAQANRDYERRFGFIFIVCATGKSVEEMLGILKERLQNDPETELRIAAEEQRKITRLRLEKLLKSPRQDKLSH